MNIKSIPACYGNLVFHQKIGEIIKQHSENRHSIKEIVHKAIHFEKINNILDIGCGYGWFEEGLDVKLDLIVGIEYLEENRANFLSITEPISKNAVFLRMLLPCPIELPSDSSDLIVSAYSLYFFPEIIPEVKRILNPEGIFVIITHSELMLEEGERFFQFKNLRTLIKRFSSENGEDMLRKYFRHVEYIDYYNRLIFDREHASELEDYINFKKEFIAKDVFPEVVRDKLLHELQERGNLSFNKNDRIFFVRK